MVKFGLLIFLDPATLIEKPLRQVNLAELFLIGRIVLIELPFLHLKFFFAVVGTWEKLFCNKIGVSK